MRNGQGRGFAHAVLDHSFHFVLLVVCSVGYRINFIRVKSYRGGWDIRGVPLEGSENILTAKYAKNAKDGRRVEVRKVLRSCDSGREK